MHWIHVTFQAFFFNFKIYDMSVKGTLDQLYATNLWASHSGPI